MVRIWSMFPEGSVLWLAVRVGGFLVASMSLVAFLSLDLRLSSRCSRLAYSLGSEIESCRLAMEPQKGLNKDLPLRSKLREASADNSLNPEPP